MVSPVLIFSLGNESRGDDALAPLLSRNLQAKFDHPDIEFIEDFQLQVEHVTDLIDRQAVLFLDADVSCIAPFHFSRITGVHDNSYTSHAMTPFALLHTYHHVYGTDAPPCFLLRIRGYSFEMGAGLSDEASANLQRATVKASEWLADVTVDGGVSS